jgi:hypothetical protein
MYINQSLHEFNFAEKINISFNLLKSLQSYNRRIPLWHSQVFSIVLKFVPQFIIFKSIITDSLLSVLNSKWRRLHPHPSLTNFIRTEWIIRTLWEEQPHRLNSIFARERYKGILLIVAHPYFSFSSFPCSLIFRLKAFFFFRRLR